MVFFGNYYHGYHGAKEAARFECGPVCVVDSDVFPDHVIYPMPSNDDSFSSLEFYVRIIAKSALLGKMYALMRFYKLRKLSAFNQMFLEKDVHWWDAVDRFFNKRVITAISNKINRKKRNFFLLKYLTFFIYFNFFNLILDASKGKKTINFRKYFGFFTLYSIYVRSFGDEFLLLNNYALNYFHIYNMFQEIVKMLISFDENYKDALGYNAYYLVIGARFKYYFHNKFFKNFFKLTPFIYFKFLLRCMANWKLFKYDLRFKKENLNTKYAYLHDKLFRVKQDSFLVSKKPKIIFYENLFDVYCDFDQLTLLSERTLFDIDLEISNCLVYTNFELFNNNINTFIRYVDDMVFRIYGNSWYKDMYLYFLNDWQTSKFNKNIYINNRNANINDFFDSKFIKYSAFVKFFKKRIFDLYIFFFNEPEFKLLRNQIPINTGELLELRRFYKKFFDNKSLLNLFDYFQKYNKSFESEVNKNNLNYFFDKLIFSKEHLTRVFNMLNSNELFNKDLYNYFVEYNKKCLRFFGYVLKPKFVQTWLQDKHSLISRKSFSMNRLEANILRRKDYKKYFNTFDFWYESAYKMYNENAYGYMSYFYTDFFETIPHFFAKYINFTNVKNSFFNLILSKTKQNLLYTIDNKLKFVTVLKKYLRNIYFLLVNKKYLKITNLDFLLKMFIKINMYLNIFKQIRYLFFQNFFFAYFKLPFQKDFFFFEYLILNSNNENNKLLFNNVTFKYLFKTSNGNTFFNSKFLVSFINKFNKLNMFINSNLFSPFVKQLDVSKMSLIRYVKSNINSTNSRLISLGKSYQPALYVNLYSHVALLKNLIYERLFFLNSKLFFFFKAGFFFVDLQTKFEKNFNTSRTLKKDNLGYLLLKVKLYKIFIFLSFFNFFSSKRLKIFKNNEFLNLKKKVLTKHKYFLKNFEFQTELKLLTKKRLFWLKNLLKYFSLFELKLGNLKFSRAYVYEILNWLKAARMSELKSNSIRFRVLVLKNIFECAFDGYLFNDFLKKALLNFNFFQKKVFFENKTLFLCKKYEFFLFKRSSYFLFLNLFKRALNKFKNRKYDLESKIINKNDNLKVTFLKNKTKLFLFDHATRENKNKFIYKRLNFLKNFLMKRIKYIRYCSAKEFFKKFKTSRIFSTRDFSGLKALYNFNSVLVKLSRIKNFFCTSILNENFIKCRLHSLKTNLAFIRNIFMKTFKVLQNSNSFRLRIFYKYWLFYFFLKYRIKILTKILRLNKLSNFSEIVSKLFEILKFAYKFKSVYMLKRLSRVRGKHIAKHRLGIKRIKMLRSQYAKRRLKRYLYKRFCEFFGKFCLKSDKTYLNKTLNNFKVSFNFEEDTKIGYNSLLVNADLFFLSGKLENTNVTIELFLNKKIVEVSKKALLLFVDEWIISLWYFSFYKSKEHMINLFLANNYVYIEHSNSFNKFQFFTKYLNVFLSKKINENKFQQNITEFNIFSKKNKKLFNHKFSKAYYNLFFFYKKKINYILALRQQYLRFGYYFKRFEYLLKLKSNYYFSKKTQRTHFSFFKQLFYKLQLLLFKDYSYNLLNKNLFKHKVLNLMFKISPNIKSVLKNDLVLKELDANYKNSTKKYILTKMYKQNFGNFGKFYNQNSFLNKFKRKFGWGFRKRKFFYNVVTKTHLNRKITYFSNNFKFRNFFKKRKFFFLSKQNLFMKKYSLSDNHITEIFLKKNWINIFKCLSKSFFLSNPFSDYWIERYYNTSIVNKGKGFLANNWIFFKWDYSIMDLAISWISPSIGLTQTKYKRNKTRSFYLCREKMLQATDLLKRSKKLYFLYANYKHLFINGSKKIKNVDQKFRFLHNILKDSKRISKKLRVFFKAKVFFYLKSDKIFDAFFSKLDMKNRLGFFKTLFDFFSKKHILFFIKKSGFILKNFIFWFFKFYFNTNQFNFVDTNKLYEKFLFRNNLKVEDDKLNLKKKFFFNLYKGNLLNFFRTYNIKKKNKYSLIILQNQKKYMKFFIKKRLGFLLNMNMYRFNIFTKLFSFYSNRSSANNFYGFRQQRTKRIWWLFWTKIFFNMLVGNNHQSNSLFLGEQKNLYFSTNNNDVKDKFKLSKKNLFFKYKRCLKRLLKRENFFKVSSKMNALSLKKDNFLKNVKLKKLFINKSRKRKRLQSVSDTFDLKLGLFGKKMANLSDKDIYYNKSIKKLKKMIKSSLFYKYKKNFNSKKNISLSKSKRNAGKIFNNPYIFKNKINKNIRKQLKGHKRAYLKFKRNLFYGKKLKTKLSLKQTEMLKNFDKKRLFLFEKNFKSNKSFGLSDYIYYFNKHLKFNKNYKFLLKIFNVIISDFILLRLKGKVTRILNFYNNFNLGSSKTFKQKNIFENIKFNKSFVFKYLSLHENLNNYVNFGFSNFKMNFFKIKGYFDLVYNNLKNNLKFEVILDWQKFDKFSNGFGFFLKKLKSWKRILMPFWVRDQFYFFKNFKYIFSKIKYFFYFLKRYKFKKRIEAPLNKVLRFLIIKLIKIFKMRDYFFWFYWVLQDVRLFFMNKSLLKVNEHVYNSVFRRRSFLKGYFAKSLKAIRSKLHLKFKQIKNLNSKFSFSHFVTRRSRRLLKRKKWRLKFKRANSLKKFSLKYKNRSRMRLFNALIRRENDYDYRELMNERNFMYYLHDLTHVVGAYVRTYSGDLYGRQYVAQHIFAKYRARYNKWLHRLSLGKRKKPLFPGQIHANFIRVYYKYISRYFFNNNYNFLKEKNHFSKGIRVLSDYFNFNKSISFYKGFYKKNWVARSKVLFLRRKKQAPYFVRWLRLKRNVSFSVHKANFFKYKFNLFKNFRLEGHNKKISLDLLKMRIKYIIYRRGNFRWLFFILKRFSTQLFSYFKINSDYIANDLNKFSKYLLKLKNYWNNSIAFFNFFHTQKRIQIKFRQYKKFKGNLKQIGIFTKNKVNLKKKMGNSFILSQYIKFKYKFFIRRCLMPFFAWCLNVWVYLRKSQFSRKFLGDSMFLSKYINEKHLYLYRWHNILHHINYKVIFNKLVDLINKYNVNIGAQKYALVFKKKGAVGYASRFKRKRKVKSLKVKRTLLKRLCRNVLTYRMEKADLNFRTFFFENLYENWGLRSLLLSAKLPRVKMKYLYFNKLDYLYAEKCQQIYSKGLLLKKEPLITNNFSLSALFVNKKDPNVVTERNEQLRSIMNLDLDYLKNVYKESNKETLHYKVLRLILIQNLVVLHKNMYKALDIIKLQQPNIFSMHAGKLKFIFNYNTHKRIYSKFLDIKAKVNKSYYNKDITRFYKYNEFFFKYVFNKIWLKKTALYNYFTLIKVNYNVTDHVKISEVNWFTAEYYNFLTVNYNQKSIKFIIARDHFSLINELNYKHKLKKFNIISSSNINNFVEARVLNEENYKLFNKYNVIKKFHNKTLNLTKK